MDQYEDFDRLFSQMHPESFTAQKLFLINDIRRRFTLTEEASVTKVSTGVRSKPSSQETAAAKASRAKLIMKSKVPRSLASLEAEKSATKKPVIKPKIPDTSVLGTSKPIIRPKIKSATTETQNKEETKSETKKKPQITPRTQD